MTEALLMGVLVGAVLGLTGAGGGILAVPALVVGMGWSVQRAAPVALIAVAFGAAVGAAEGFRKGLVRYKAAALMAIAGVPVTSVGLHMARLTPPRILLALFAIVMLLVAARMILQARESDATDTADRLRIARLNPETGKIAWSWPTVALMAAIGGFTGFMTGLLGVGGGFVIVPMLRRFTQISMHGIVATSLFVVALVGFGGVAAAMLRGETLPLNLTILFTVAMVCGMVLGRAASSRLSSKHVQLGFALVLLVVASGMLAKATLSS
jgi:uncharacterized membrane protein YfcA